MTHLSTVLLKIKRQPPNLSMKILRVYINGPVIGELRLMQQKLSPCYFIGKKWLIYHPYSLMGPCLKTQNPISILVSFLTQMVNGIIILMKYIIKETFNSF
jgi:hypothetical protein